MGFFSSLSGALFSLSFYRKIIREPLTRGLLYLLGWSFGVVLLFSVFLTVRVYPEVRDFLNWFTSALPPIQWTPEGVRMAQKSPYELKHPRYGHVATVNLDRKEVTDADIGDAMIYLTSEKLYVKESRRSTKRVYDLVPAEKGQPPRGNFIVDGPFIRGLEKNIKPVALTLMLFLVFIGFFVWKLLGAFFYSFLGMLVNLMRRERLPYEAVLNVSLFAMTAAMCIQLFLITFQTYLGRVPFGFAGSFLLTSLYLYFGIKLSEEEPEPLEETEAESSES